MQNEKYYGVRNKFIVGIICYIVGVACAYGGHFHANNLDLKNLLYYDVTTLEVYAFVGCTLLAFVLMGIPFIRLDCISTIFLKLIANLSEESHVASNVAKADGDYFETKSTSYEYKGNIYVNKEYESKFMIVCKKIINIILLIVLGIILYVASIGLSIFVLIGQIIYLIFVRKKDSKTTKEKK